MPMDEAARTAALKRLDAFIGVHRSRARQASSQNRRLLQNPTIESVLTSSARPCA